MHTLPLSFAILSFWGLWRPVSWSSRNFTFLYNMLSIFVMILLYTFCLSECLRMLQPFDNLDEFTNSSFWCLATVLVCLKAATILMKRRKIVQLANMLLDEHCLPRTRKEEYIQKKYDKVARFNTLCFLILGEITASMMAFGPLIKRSGSNRELPFEAYLPYNASSTDLIFWANYAHQTVGIIAAACINIAHETLVTGMMLQLCAQLDILSYRLVCATEIRENSATRETEYVLYRREQNCISKCVQHHDFLFGFARQLNDIFSRVILAQFFVTIVDICTSLYLLSTKAANSVDFVINSLGLASILFQIFLYCWYGNEVILKGLDLTAAAFNASWFSMSIDAQRSLIMIMMKSSRPIQFTTASIFVLSLKTYVAVCIDSPTLHVMLFQNITFH